MVGAFAAAVLFGVSVRRAEKFAVAGGAAESAGARCYVLARFCGNHAAVILSERSKLCKVKGVYKLKHIIFGRAAAASLLYALRKKEDEVIGFPVDFSTGPLKQIHQEEGISRHFSWLQSAYAAKWSDPLEEQAAYLQALQRLQAIEQKEKITIWTCENAAEQIGLRICASLLKGKDVHLQVVNTFDAMLEQPRDKNTVIHIRHTGECSPDQLQQFYEHALQPVSDEARGVLEDEGAQLLQSESFFRSWSGGQIVHEAESKHDRWIIDCIKQLESESEQAEFVPAVQVVGEVLGLFYEAVSDAWIEYRIRSLIKEGKLLHKGNTLRKFSYKIKTVQHGQD